MRPHRESRTGVSATKQPGCAVTGGWQCRGSCRRSSLLLANRTGRIPTEVYESAVPGSRTIEVCVRGKKVLTPESKKIAQKNPKEGPEAE